MEDLVSLDGSVITARNYEEFVTGLYIRKEFAEAEEYSA